MVQTLRADLDRIPLGGRALDFGAGYVASDSLALWLLGMDEVVAVDLNAIAKPEALVRAVRGIDENQVAEIRRFLQPERLTIFNERLQKVRSAADENLPAPPFTYLAPFDVLAIHQHGPTDVDLLWSTSVLEHIRPSLLPSVLDALTGMLSEGGAAYHFIDLRDHLNFEVPFAFGSADIPFDPEANADERGNGMTVEDWRRLVAGREGAYEVRTVQPASSKMDLSRPEFILLVQRRRAARHFSPAT